MKKRGGEKGAVLIATFILLMVLTFMAAALLSMSSTHALSIGYGIPEAQALWLAEAGMEKAIWNLKTPVTSGGQGENWTTAGTAENLGNGSYTMVIAAYDFALAANGAAASDSPAQTDSARGPAKAIDGNGAAYWESRDRPQNNNPQDLVIAFPYPLTINKARFLAPAAHPRPRDYTWAVSTDGTDYTAVITVTNNNSTDVTDVFAAQSNVNYLRLRTTRIGGGSTGVRIAALEVAGRQINSTGTVGSSARTVAQTVAADDGSPENRKAYHEMDWTEA